MPIEEIDLLVKMLEAKLDSRIISTIDQVKCDYGQYGREPADVIIGYLTDLVYTYWEEVEIDEEN